MRAWKTCKAFLLVQLTLVAATRLPATETSFNPSLALAQYYTNNVNFVSENQPSDTYTALSLSLPVTIQTQRSTASLSYSTTYQSFDKFTGFDNLSHAFKARLGTSWSRANSLNLSAEFYRGQDQGRVDSDLEGDFFLTERSTRNEGRFRVDYSDRFSKAWLWGIGASAGSLSYEEISGTDVIPPPQDRDSLGANAWFGRQISPTMSVGFRAEVDQFRYDISSDQLVQLYSFEVNRRLSRQSNLYLSLGGFIEMDSESMLPGEPETRSTGFQGSFAYAKSFDAFDILLAASHRPTLGSTRGGASTNSYASFNLSKNLAKRLSGGLGLRYSRTEPLAETLDGTESASIGGNLRWHALRVLSLAMTAAYTLQSPLGTGSIPTSSDSSVLTASFSLVWYPLAKRPIAQGAS